MPSNYTTCFRALEAIGYVVAGFRVNPKLFGVPQHRDRIYFAAIHVAKATALRGDPAPIDTQAARNHIYDVI
eukprot:4802941-Pyramimonas_sp.AAC.1